MVPVTSLLLPALLGGVALFFASFLSWMVLQLHKQDWRKVPDEDAFLEALRKLEIPPENYMFPMAETPEKMKEEGFQAKLKQGPQGVLTTFGGPVDMGRNLGLTLLYFVVTSFCIGYLAKLGLETGAGFTQVFRFVSTAGLLTYLSGIVQHAIWFRCRVTGHVIESVAYGLILGTIYGLMWPVA